MNPGRPPTDFELAVYAIVREIPAGRVTTYGEIARRLGRGSARAVGSALARNPFAPEVPCHRVVRADGSLGGFHGETSGPRITEKLQMLREEGVSITPDHRTHPSAMVDSEERNKPQIHADGR